MKRTLIRIRPHHLLDILRDFGNGIERKPHRWSASVASVSKAIVTDIHQTITVVMGVDSICETCSKLKGAVCTAHITPDLLMRDYNDPLDEKLFSRLDLIPNTEIPLIDFLRKIDDNMEVLDLFTSPSNNPEVRRRGTVAALIKLGVKRSAT